MNCFKTYKVLFSNYLVCLILCIGYSINSYSQNKDSSLHQLNEVLVLESKENIIEISKKTVKFDSILLQKYNTSSLADLLSSQSTIHVKTYGNSNIATTSMRGGNANHTAIIWNGLNIQNAMLGQADLSILPTLFFDDVSLEYGGGSSIWGSGAIGGSIHLQNKTLFNQGLKTKIQMSVGSFNSKKLATSISLGNKKITSNTKIFYNKSDNNYTYKDTTDKENPNKQMNHANYQAKGIIQEVSILIKENQKINIRGWYNNLFRNLPSLTSFNNKHSQEDDNLKLNADWNYTKGNLNSIIRIGYFNDRINYIDSSAAIYSNSKIKTFIVENDNLYYYKKHNFNFGVNYTQYNNTLIQSQSSITKSDYSTHHHLIKFAVFVSYNTTLLKSKLNYNLNVRKETTSISSIPFTGNTGFHYQLFKTIATKISANKSYRQPTLNDLYWPQSGNPNLKAEDSYEFEGGLVFNYKKNNFIFLMEGSYFNRHTKNWIIWLPAGNSLWSPKNIAEVYSRGTETKTELSYLKKDVFIKLILQTSYVLSTNQKATSENDNSEGRQLIFTPRYIGQGSLIIKYKQLSVLFNSNYTGYRFITSDNTSWMTPYYIANFKCSYSYTVSSVNIELFGSINNLFNKNYQVIQNNPMPLRNFEFGMSMNYHKKKKDKQKTITPY